MTPVSIRNKRARIKAAKKGRPQPSRNGELGHGRIWPREIVELPVDTIKPAQGGNLLDAALDYHHHHGMSIIPIIGKVPPYRLKWGKYRDHPAEDAELRRLMSRPGITGIAVILGSASHGLACRDYDNHHAYDGWASANPDLATTLPTVQTSRGYHVYHRAKQERFVNLPDGEYRGDYGHYVVLPPSRHPDGPLYRWTISLSDDIPVVDPVSAGLIPNILSQTQTHTALTTKNFVSDFVGQTQAYSLHVSDTPQPHEETALTENVSKHVSEHMSDAIAATLPTGPGQRDRRLFDLARRLKAIMPSASPSELEPIVRQWHTSALPVIRTKDWIESWLDFGTAWAAVKRPAGASMAEIVEAANKQTPKDADAVAKLTALCRTLQEHHGSGKAWPLSCRRAGQETGVSHDTAARILKLLCREGTIELVTPSGPKESRRAAEYRYLGGDR
jgi:hypothetical protein